ncbi:MAG: phage head closure protein [Parvularculaceae bacterium]
MIGYLRRRIELLAAMRVDDGAGGASLEWSVVEPAWAEITQLASAIDLSGERRAARKRLVATIRWRAGPQAGWRIRLQGTDYEIMSIEAVDGKERFMTLVCEEVAA